MKRLLTATVVVLLFSVMFIMGVCVAAGPYSIPTTAKWTGTLYNVGLCTLVPPGNHILTVNIGEGVSSVMGSAQFVLVSCVDPATFTGAGWGVVTTANGDTLHLDIPNITVTFSESAPREWSETEIIVGGTGKFENAIGSSFSHGTFTSGTDPFPFENQESPPLLLAPEGWVGTSEGEITF